VEYRNLADARLQINDEISKRVVLFQPCRTHYLLTGTA